VRLCDADGLYGFGFVRFEVVYCVCELCRFVIVLCCGKFGAVYELQVAENWL
jgi:hypothetical protein